MADRVPSLLALPFTLSLSPGRVIAIHLKGCYLMGRARERESEGNAGRESDQRHGPRLTSWTGCSLSIPGIPAIFLSVTSALSVSHTLKE